MTPFRTPTVYHRWLGSHTPAIHRTVIVGAFGLIVPADSSHYHGRGCMTFATHPRRRVTWFGTPRDPGRRFDRRSRLRVGAGIVPERGIELENQLRGSTNADRAVQLLTVHEGVRSEPIGLREQALQPVGSVHDQLDGPYELADVKTRHRYRIPEDNEIADQSDTTADVLGCFLQASPQIYGVVVADGRRDLEPLLIVPHGRVEDVDRLAAQIVGVEHEMQTVATRNFIVNLVVRIQETLYCGPVGHVISSSSAILKYSCLFTGFVGPYFQNPSCWLQTCPVLLQVLQVNFPNIPLARPPLQAWQS